MIVASTGITWSLSVAVGFATLCACAYYVYKLLQGLINPAWYMAKYTLREAKDIFNSYRQ
jgi:hypothetical protein